jgi:hypothetical protein
MMLPKTLRTASSYCRYWHREEKALALVPLVFAKDARGEGLNVASPSELRIRRDEVCARENGNLRSYTVERTRSRIVSYTMVVV